MMGLPGRERSFAIALAVIKDTIHQRDRRTPGDSKVRAYAQRRAVTSLEYFSRCIYFLFFYFTATVRTALVAFFFIYKRSYIVSSILSLLITFVDDELVLVDVVDPAAP